MARNDINMTHMDYIFGKIEPIGQKLVKNMRARTEIMIQKMDAAEKIDQIIMKGKNKSEFLIYTKALKESNTKEKELIERLKIEIPQALEQVMEFQKTPGYKPNAEQKKFIQQLERILELIDENLGKIEDRIDIEEEFLNNPGAMKFGEFYDMLIIETEMDRKILNIINPAGINELDKYRNPDMYRDGAVAGAVGGILGIICTTIYHVGVESDKVFKLQQKAILERKRIK